MTERGTRRLLLRDAASKLPRVSLAQLPTALHELSRLQQRLDGPRLFVKRDDLTGLAFGGNKTRMFEFVLGRAIADGATQVVAGSAAQSNYARQLAAACAQLGLECHLVLRRIRGVDDLENGNLLIDRLLGAHVKLIDDDLDTQVILQRQLATELEAAGRRVFRLPRASSDHYALHSVAYVLAMAELDEQLAELEVSPTHIYITTLDMTHAGLLLGLRALGSPTRLVAVSPFESTLWPADRIRGDVLRLAGEAAQLLRIDEDLSGEDVAPRTGLADEGYGSPTAADISAIGLFAESEGLLLDPVYTCKAASALIQDVRDGTLTSSDTVIFWHTGGTPALFAYRAAISGGPTSD